MSKLHAEGEIIDAQTVRFERLLPGPIERVWAYLTESEKRRKWLAAGDMDLRAGGRAPLRFNPSELTPHQEATPEKYRKKFNGNAVVYWEITRCEPPWLLAARWGEKVEDSEVTFELQTRGNDVLLTVTHRRLADRDFMVSVAGGWHVHLDILADHLNGCMPPPFWATHARLAAEYEKRIPAERA
jgi:uncharacterized protein YndB with AHSA1/START domain